MCHTIANQQAVVYVQAQQQQAHLRGTINFDMDYSEVYHFGNINNQRLMLIPFMFCQIQRLPSKKGGVHTLNWLCKLEKFFKCTIPAIQQQVKDP